MGLDMYLTADIYLFTCYDLPIVIKVNDIPLTIDKDCMVEKELIYWRKANAIHKWFVENCGGGVDECQKMWVTKDYLKYLLSICERVMEDKSRASELLPTQSGCFFGSLEYDDSYFEDIQFTIDKLKEVINNPLYTCIHYQASW